jgi:hypothetical protein
MYMDKCHRYISQCHTCIPECSLSTYISCQAIQGQTMVGSLSSSIVHVLLSTKPSTKLILSCSLNRTIPNYHICHHQCLGKFKRPIYIYHPRCTITLPTIYYIQIVSVCIQVYELIAYVLVYLIILSKHMHITIM